jgi:hypothetical protein
MKPLQVTGEFHLYTVPHDKYTQKFVNLFIENILYDKLYCVKSIYTS